MQNRTGKPVLDEDFFPRVSIINRIYRRLEAGNHIFMAAPRRVGKTSIMYYLEHNPRPNYIFVYAVVQSVHDTEDFYKRLLEAISQSKAISRLSKTVAGVGKLMGEMFKRIGSFSFGGVEIETKDVQPNYQQEFTKLLKELDAGDQTIVLMIDEFPDTVLNIAKKHGNDAGIQFLQDTREQRQNATKNFLFIITGSIGLPNVVARLMPSNQIINDLDEVVVQPLGRSEATDFFEQLFASYEIPYENDLIPQLLDNIEWLIPFHLQLLFKEILDIYDQIESTIKPIHIEQAFNQLLRSRNTTNLDHYYARLKDEPLAILLLNAIAKKNALTAKKLEELSKTNSYTLANHTTTIDMLVFDGYIFKTDEKEQYRFNSLLLKKWWLKYVCN